MSDFFIHKIHILSLFTLIILERYATILVWRGLKHTST
nr:MAG TPA: hypothetical protein [Bacteriophage sp.]